MRKGRREADGINMIKCSTGSFETLEDSVHSAELTKTDSCSCVSPQPSSSSLLGSNARGA